MNAKAVDILGKFTPLDLSEFSHIAICGLVVEIRDGVLTIRNPRGTLLVRPIVGNQIEVCGD